jgi:hypothetical protein
MFFKKIKFSISLILFATIFIPCFSYAETQAQNSGYIDDLSKQTQAFGGKQGADFGLTPDPRSVAARVINILLGLVGMMVLAYAVYGGYMIMMSGGNEEMVGKGKNILKNSAIGLFLILSAYAIAQFAVKIAMGGPKKTGDYIEVLPDNSSYYQDPLIEPYK